MSQENLPEVGTYVRIGDEIVFADSTGGGKRVFHRDLLRQLLGGDFSIEQLKQRASDFGPKADAGSIMCFTGGPCILSRRSFELLFPSPENYTEAKGGTAVLLRERFGVEVNIKDDD